MNRIHAIILSAPVLLLPVPASHATDVGGLITVDETWTAAGNPYNVISTIQVVLGATLTIEAGVELRFGPCFGLSVGAQGAGTLVVNGTEVAPVIFTSGDPFDIPPGIAEPGDWGNVFFLDEAVDALFVDGNYASGSKLEHVIIEYAGCNDTPAIWIQKSSPYLLNCEIRHNAYRGIDIDGELTPAQRIESCEIWDCHLVGHVPRGAGIHLVGGGGHLFTGNWVHNCTVDGFGAYAAGLFINAPSTLSGNTISQNSSTGTWSEAGGAYFGAFAASSVLTGNTVTGNYAGDSGGGLLFSGSSGHTLTGNTIADNSADNNYAFQLGGGGGVYFRSSAGYILTDNIITGNTANGGGWGGGAYAYGGNVTFIGNTITNNTSTSGNGGGLVGGGTNITFDGDTISNNTAGGNGGGLHLQSASSSNLAGLTIIGNTAGGNGGGLDVASSAGTSLTDSRLIGNAAQDEGGAISLVDSNDFTVSGSDIRCNESFGGATGGINVVTSLRLSLAGDEVMGITNRITQNTGCQVRNTNDAAGIPDADIQAQYVDWGCLDLAGINDAVCDHNDMIAWAYVVWLGV